MNICLIFENFLGTNTIAYFGVASVMKKNIFLSLKIAANYATLSFSLLLWPNKVEYLPRASLNSLVQHFLAGPEPARV
jgi:hypothetical protein